MRNYKQLAVSISILPFLISGCTSTNKNIQIMEKQKQYKSKENINISSDIGYKAYLDSDNNLKYICMNDNKSGCGYYSHYKHSYKSGTPDEEFILINKDGYYPPISPNMQGVQCGAGSLFGWLAVFGMEPFGIENYSQKNPKSCYSKFTKVDSTQIGDRIAFGLLTFMTPFVTGGTMHTNKFNKEGFIDSIYISNIETFRKQLLDVASTYNLQGGIDIIYLKQGSIDDNLEDKYNSLLKDKSLKAGVLFMEEDTNRLLAINIFDKFKNKDVLESISLQIEDILSNISKNNQYILKYEDIVSYIPKEIPLPAIPSVEKLTKDEFETKKNFNNRVIVQVKKRENKIRSLQRQYSLDVFERNAYINNLQESYKNYIEYKAEEKNKMLHEIKENLPLLSKVLFMENISGYDANNFKYDAEEKKLYFTIYSRQKKFKQDVVSVIPPEIAKKIKMKQSFKIIPQIESTQSQLTLRSFDILETESNSLYKINYTNVNFKPESITLRVTGMKESMKQEISTYFQRFKQKDSSIIDTSKKEIWYIDIVKNINAKIPKWFINPSLDGKTIGYGEGKTLAEAKINARMELAFMKKVNVNSNLEISKEINNLKSFSEVKQSVKQDTSVKLEANEYKLYKQEMVDGIWYVGFEYLK